MLSILFGYLSTSSFPGKVENIAERNFWIEVCLLCRCPPCLFQYLVSLQLYSI